MGIGAAGYFVSFLLFALQKTGDSYWAFAFPGFVLSVVGADLEFNVANVRSRSHAPADIKITFSIQIAELFVLPQYEADEAIDVRDVVPTLLPAVSRRRNIPNRNPALRNCRPRRLDGHFQRCPEQPDVDWFPRGRPCTAVCRDFLVCGCDFWVESFPGAIAQDQDARRAAGRERGAEVMIV